MYIGTSSRFCADLRIITVRMSRRRYLVRLFKPFLTYPDIDDRECIFYNYEEII